MVIEICISKANKSVSKSMPDIFDLYYLANKAKDLLGKQINTLLGE